MEEFEMALIFREHVHLHEPSVDYGVMGVTAGGKKIGIVRHVSYDEAIDAALDISDWIKTVPFKETLS